MIRLLVMNLKIICIKLLLIKVSTNTFSLKPEDIVELDMYVYNSVMGVKLK
jgi:hypothetical protein